MANQVKIQIVATADTGAIDRVAASLRKLKDKKVKIDIDVDKDKLNKLNNLNKRMRIKVDVDRDTDRLLRALGDGRNRRQTINVDIDTDSMALAQLRAQLAALAGQVVPIAVEVAQIEPIRAEDESVTIEVDEDGAEAANAAIDAAARNRSSTIHVDTDVDRATISRLLNTLNNMQQSGNNAGRGLAAAAGGAGALSGVVSKLTPSLAVIAPAIGVLGTGAITGGIYATAAALGAVTAGAGVMSASMTGALAALPIMAAASSEEVSGHFDYMVNDVTETMKNIAQPVQQPLVNMATAVGAAFHQVRPALDNITAGTSDLVNHLSGKLPEIAAEAGPAMEKIFGAGVPHMKNLMDTLPDLTKSFGDLGASLGSPEVVQGAQRIFDMIPTLVSGAGKGIEGIATAFNNVMGFFDSGKMDGFTEGLGNVINSFSSADWSGVTEGISGAANAFGDFIGSIDGQAVADGIAGITDSLTGLTQGATAAVDAFNFLNNGVKDLTAASGKESKGLVDSILGGMGFTGAGTDMLNAIKGMLSEAGGGAEVNIPVKVTPEVEPLDPGTALGGLGDTGFTIPILGEFTVPEPPAIPPPPPVPLSLDPSGLLLPPIASPPPVPVDLTAEPIPAPAPPPPVPVDVVVADGQVTVPQPPPVPVTFDVTQPELNLSVPPVPISFNVTMPDISIPPVEANAFVTVTSNAAAVAAEISALSAGTSSFHTVSTNAAAVAGEIQSLNGMNTSSTHTINVVKTGDTGPGTGR